MNNFDKAIEDLKYVSSIDANFEDAVKVIQAFINLVNQKEQIHSNNSVYFCFICSGNSSLITSFYDTFQAAGLNLQMMKYSIDTQVLKANYNKAKSLELPFMGMRFFAMDEDNIDKCEDVLNQMANSANQVLYIFFIVVAQEEVYIKVQLLYNDILKKAVNQGIIPFPMFVTQTEDSKNFLIETFK